MIVWYINQAGGLYYGDMIAGDREATPEEVAALRPAPDPKQALRDQIVALEREQLMPRATREYMLLDLESRFAPEVLALNPGYQAVKAFDNQIRDLRGML